MELRIAVRTPEGRPGQATFSLEQEEPQQVQAPRQTVRLTKEVAGGRERSEGMLQVRVLPSIILPLPRGPKVDTVGNGRTEDEESEEEEDSQPPQSSPPVLKVQHLLSISPPLASTNLY